VVVVAHVVIAVVVVSRPGERLVVAGAVSGPLLVALAFAVTALTLGALAFVLTRVLLL
jgi:hypothetical protein